MLGKTNKNLKCDLFFDMQSIEVFVAL